ncbi:LEAF RUST 10 DISEASE-RESISTANCE LOCUS RECEPTOR-LIKE PROTEIN KINASE-like 1.1 [Silene latifolia]|uniref:LEAF RUST 10 DISEASE-RESISTANCE LOCUS RECEPTOR-LIKE PROTEIN KINASE-like 1.1 n=1 Tax=Silene latifolia TaxID=37657 RepID=UPI003D777332
MASISIALIIFLSYCLLQLPQGAPTSCPSSFRCATLGVLGYPFTTSFNPSCGLSVLNCTEPTPTIGLTNSGPWYDVLNSFSSNRSFLVGDYLMLHIVNDKCDVIENRFRLPRSSSVSFTVLINKTVWDCPTKFDDKKGNRSGTLRRLTDCPYHNVYHMNDTLAEIPGCDVVKYPAVVMVDLSDQCSQCISESGSCQDLPNDGFRCINKRKERRRRRLILGLGISVGSIVIVLAALLCWYLKKTKFRSLGLTSRNLTREPRRMKTDLEASKVYFSVPIFSYSELEESTNNFDSNRELGDGGYGTVYYGKLKDGREVAVKRLYQRNFRQLEQFMNEIEILAGLRHQNLVSLYGCTSQRSKELLLVYEYVPNGTVADHLNGDQSKCGTLTWPVRLSIAIETAKALAYLHASDIIHRDVKSNNILLDSNFCVKVADFGLSRLFPMDVTHVSTAPQGTPGYLDPEYHQCYQLTDKSDVYSFGVVLVELISSLPAIDICREHDEINLSIYAMKRIQSGAIDELVDHRLGFETNCKTKRMITLVAELAFQCLQQRKELRPSMIEVVQALKTIESTDCDTTMVSKTRVEGDDTWLLRNKESPPSPVSVIQKWGSSKSITPTVSK